MFYEQPNVVDDKRDFYQEQLYCRGQILRLRVKKFALVVVHFGRRQSGCKPKTLTSPGSTAEMSIHANSALQTTQQLMLDFFFFHSLLEQGFSVTALLTRKTAVRRTVKIDWNDYVFFQDSQKVLSSAVGKVGVLQMSWSKNIQIASKIPKSFQNFVHMYLKIDST